MGERIINLAHEPSFWLGDRFFKVEKRNKKPYRDTENSEMTFATKCPSCNDDRMIRYTGADGRQYEAQCPVCKSSYGVSYGNRITLSRWEVHEYIVNTIAASGDPVLAAYKNGQCVIENLSLRAFCRTGRCADDYVEAVVPSWTSDIDPDIEKFNLDQPGFTPKDFVFRSKKDAERFQAMLIDHDKKRLDDFNKKYKTEHTYPF